MKDVNYLMKHSSFQRESYSSITLRTTDHRTAWDNLYTEQCKPCEHPDPSKKPLPWLTPPWDSPQPPLQFGTHSFESISLLCPPLPGKVIKLFFSTSCNTLCLWESIWRCYTEAISASILMSLLTLNIGNQLTNLLKGCKYLIDDSNKYKAFKIPSDIE